jgi:sugar lactone lactonase YvrE
VRRLLGLCAVAVMVFAAIAVAQNGVPGSAIVVTAQDYPYFSLSSRQPNQISSVLRNVVGRSVTVVPPEARLADVRYGSSNTNPGIDSSAGPVAYPTGGEVLATISNTPEVLLAGPFPGGGVAVNVIPPFPPPTVAGTAKSGFSGDGAIATASELDPNVDSLVKRSGLAVAADGTLYIADTSNSTIRAVTGAASSEAGIIRSVAGKWAAQDVRLVEPLGIAVDRAGNLYIADHTAGTVSVLTKATGQVTILAHVASPASLAVTNDGSKVFVASPETGGVFTIATLTRAIATVPDFAPLARESTPTAGPCAALEAATTSEATHRAAASASISAAAARPICPAGLAVDGGGNLFVADGNNGNILRVDATTNKTTPAAVGMIEPGDIAFDGQGDLFVSEQGRNRIIAMGALGDPASNLALTAPAPPAGCPQGASFTYCNEPSAGTSASFAFTLTNTSASTISGIVISPAFVPPGTNPPPAPTNFTTTSTSCTATLTAGASCTISVAFTPLASGPIIGQVQVTDGTPSDTETINLAGTGDDFGLAIVAGLSPEVTVSQGNTATWSAQLNADNVFGAQGETVQLACPGNLPEFTTCEFKPCPVIPTVGGATAFSILVHTSTATLETPPIPNPCDSPEASARVRSGAPAGLLLINTGSPSGGAPQFPAMLCLFAAIALLSVGSFAIRRSASPGARRGFALLTLVLVGGGIIAACHKSNANSTATPTATTVMNVTANAFDSSGNSMQASRGLQITLDVIKQSSSGPLPGAVQH